LYSIAEPHFFGICGPGPGKKIDWGLAHDKLRKYLKLETNV
jgi:hypothetical protein